MLVLRLSLERTWKAVVVMCACLFLAACTKPVSIRKPFEVSRAGEVVSAQFTVRRSGGYSFSLMFVKAPVFEDIKKQQIIWGGPYKDGIGIDMNIRIIRDGVLMLNQNVRTVGTSWGQGFYWGSRHINASARVVHTLGLPPGDYVVEMRTLRETPEFRDIETFAEFSYDDPKV
ncbi:DUF5625 family protein [Pseudomonas sp. KNUC1026]|uniref:DUF5625 family protein n=1 Tax=Pseudomonas sp. KNUC1026 TaxID=2893890 RepID=UPI001F16B8BB|nr:DUF5625 family protein [Pseudomonas sp. KNUC1026]UFH49384.1 DUF5625 family protein [Pseudomonas sp. KNUC1026]